MKNNKEQIMFRSVLALVTMGPEKYERVRVELRAKVAGMGDNMEKYVNALLRLTDSMRGDGVTG